MRCVVVRSIVLRTARAITISTVPVGNAGNLRDPASTYGAVNYAYSIGTTEVTNSQYVAFLNAVAAYDPYGLYNTDMEGWGIVRKGVLNSRGSAYIAPYTYSVEAPALNGSYTYDNKPVVYVTWADAARFANWLSNGQPAGAEGPGTTETGSYTINGAVTVAALMAVTRNAGATWVLPTENEWYKAAYYNPNTGSYYTYPTSSNSVPNNNPPSADTGNSANYGHPGSTYALTDTGAYALSPGPYGTFDQGGNVWEWDEAAVSGAYRKIRGGSWYYGSGDLRVSSSQALTPSVDFPFDGYNDVGIRVVSLAEPVPEPGSLALFSWTGVLVLAARRGRK